MTQPELLKFIENDINDFAFGHFAVTGAKIGNTDYELKDGVPVKLLEKYRKVFLGDIHKAQTVKNCHYVGAPYANNLGEIDYDKSVSYIELPVTKEEKGKVERIPINDTLNFIKADVDLSKDFENIFTQMTLNFKEGNSKTIALFSVKGTKSQFGLQNFDSKKTKQQLLELGFYDVKFKYDIVDDREKSEFEFEEFTDASNLILEAVNRYGKDQTEVVINHGDLLLGEAYEAAEIKN